MLIILPDNTFLLPHVHLIYVQIYNSTYTSIYLLFTMYYDYFFASSSIPSSTFLQLFYSLFLPLILGNFWYSTVVSVCSPALPIYATQPKYAHFARLKNVMEFVACQSIHNLHNNKQADYVTSYWDWKRWLQRSQTHSSLLQIFSSRTSE